MAVVEDIEVVMDLDDRQFTVKIRNASAENRRFAKSVDDIDRRVKKMSHSMRGATATVRDWSVIIGQARNVLHQLWYVTGAWTQSLVKTSAEVERLTKLMEGMSKADTAAGRVKEAADNVDALFEAARNAPFSMNTLSDSFVKFKSVGLDPLDGSMQALTDAVAAFGGTDETFNRASIAIQQMAGKGVISMEELRQQLGEAVPQAITIMAQSMGVTYGELVDQISKGTVAAKPALDAMFNGMQAVYGGKAKMMMETYNGRVAKMKSTWAELVAKNDGISSFFDAQKEGVSALTDMLGTEAVSEIATAIGDMLSNTMTRITGLIQDFSTIYSSAKAFFTLVNRASLNPNNFVYYLRTSLIDVISLIGFAGKEFARIVKQITAATMGLTSEELDKKLFEERLRNGAEFTADEYDMLVEAHEEGTAKLERLKNERDELLRGIIENSDFAENDLKARGEALLTYDQFEKTLNEALAAKRHLDELQAQLEQKKAEQRAALNDVQMLSVDGSADEKYDANVAAANAGIAVSNLETQIASLQSAYDILKSSISATTQAYGTSEAELRQNMKPALDEFGNAALASSDAISIMSTSSNKVLRDTAERVIQLEEEMQKLANVDVDLSEALDETMPKKIDAMLQEGLEVVDEFEAGLGTSVMSMREEVSAILDDSALSQEQRFAQATEIVNKFYADQSHNLVVLVAAAQEAMAAQGMMGAIAAHQMGEKVMEILAKLGSDKDSYLKGIETGIVPVSGSSGGKKGGGGKSKGQRATEKLKELIEKTNREAEKLGKTLADPFSYQLPSAIDKAREKIDKLAKDMSGGKWTTEMKALFDQMATNAVTEELIEMKEATRDIERALMGEREARNDIYDEEVARIADMKEKLIEMGLWRVEWEQIIQAQLKGLQEELKSKSPMGEFANEWKDLFDDLEQNAADTFGNISKEIANMVTEGEADFASLTRSAINSMLEISINAAMSGLYDWGSDLVSGWIGGMGGGAGKAAAAVKHTGGMVGGMGMSRSVDASLFAGAPRFHTGGIVGDEVPIIAKKGEGVFTEEQMKAIGKGMSNQSTAAPRVNIINETGTPVESSEANTRMDAEGMILDVVLSASGRPGKFRESLKEVLK